MFDPCAFFDSLDMFGIRLGLDAVKELAAIAGNPQNSLKFIHIAGTNGKGSTGAMLEKALRSCGMKTGFYSSPHLVDIRERFRINGRCVARDTFARECLALKEACAGKRFSYFEFATVLAMQIFLNAGCDIVIWETGMGGRLDATNIVIPEAAVITNIALDHQGHLGDTVAAIAGEKAGILKPGVPLFHGRLVPEAAAVIYERASELGIRVFPPRESVPAANGNGNTFIYDGHTVQLGLPGKMQRENFRIVYEILKYFAPRWGFDPVQAAASLRDVRWPGRFHHLNSRLIVDGGHNPDGVRAFAEALQENHPGEKFTVVYAAFGDKHAENCLPYLIPFARRFIFTSVGTPGREAFTPEQLAAFAGNVEAQSVMSPVDAVETALAEKERVIVSGSLYLAGMVLERYAPESALDL